LDGGRATAPIQRRLPRLLLVISGKNNHEQESKQFATLLGEALMRQGLPASLHHAEKIPGESRPVLDTRLGIYRFDNLQVLKNASMPAALLETGIVLNRMEEEAIRHGSYHKKVATALVKSIQQFCALHATGQ
jgi:N-acetylmuramoyl-L-alanine amidase